MGRAPCCDKANVKKGPWSQEEDAKLKAYIEKHGTGGNWIALPQKIGLKRCGKSCRLRWLNYLRPNIKHGDFSEQEDNIICSLYLSIGSRWSIIASQLPGRTDNDIKNYWNTKLKKKLLGKQRKDQRGRSTANFLKQETKMGIENLLPMEAINVCPQLQQEVPLPAMLPLQEVHAQQDHESVRNQLIMQEGNFYDDHHLSNRNCANHHYDLFRDISYIQGQTSENSLHMPAPSTSHNSLRSSYTSLPTSNCGPIDGMIASNFYCYNDVPSELDDFVYNNQEKLDDFGGLSGVAEVDSFSRGTATTTSEITTSFEDTSSLLHSPVVFNYDICQPPIPQNCIFQDSMHLGTQQRHCTYYDIDLL